jgi:predicted RND superfamily exporter protein/signal transduction histidine kinase
MADEISRELAAVPGIRHVQSPTNAPILMSTPEGFSARRLVEGGEFPEDVQDLSDRGLRDPFWVGTLVTEEGTVGAIIAQLQDSKSETSVRVIDSLLSILEPFESEGFEFYLDGHPVAIAIGGQELADSTAALTPIAAALVALIIFALSRSWQTVAASMLTMALALLWTFGLLGWLGWPQDSILEILAPLILVVGICDTIHFLALYGVELGKNSRTEGDASLAIVQAAREVSGPCLLTTLTTAGAFLSFVTSDLATFVRFGAISAFGVVACFILTFALLPIILRWLPAAEAGAERTSDAWTAALEGIVRTSERRALPILAATFALFVVCGIGWMVYLRVDTDVFEMFGDRSRVAQGIRFMENRFGRSETLEIELALPAESTFEDPQVIQTVARFSDSLSETYGLGPSTSAVTFMSRLNRVLHADAPAYERPADTVEGNAELLELVGFELPTTLESWITIDRSRLRLSVEALELSVVNRGGVLESVRDHVRTLLPPDWHVTLTGGYPLAFDWVENVQGTQLRSFPTAFALVFGMVALFLRSLRLAGIAMVPTLLPVVVTLGGMGLLGMSLDVGRSMIGAVVLGIAVDDAIHLLARYRRLRSEGSDAPEAIRGAILHVGRAIITTSIALSIGFLSLLTSAWQTVSSFGFFVALAILGALAADLFVLPSLIFAFSRHRAASREARDWGGMRAVPRPAVLTLLVVLPVVGTIVSASLLAAHPGSSRELACWFLPNGHVALVPNFDSGCPLFPHERVRSVIGVEGPSFVRSFHPGTPIDKRSSNVQVAVVRDGEERWVDVPVRNVSVLKRAARLGSAILIAGILLCIPLALLWRSSSPAAAPFAFFYSANAVMVIAMLAGRHSAGLTDAALVSAVASPAILAHLALTFPRERRVVRSAPRVILIPYLVSGLLLAPAWVGLHRDALLWPPVVYLLLALSAGAWIILVATCGFAIRESTSSLERARARLLWYGSLLLPMVPTMALVRYGDGATRTVATYLAIAAVVMPMPIGLAISRYNLFNLELDVRNWIARGVYLVGAASILTVVFWVTHALVGRPDAAPEMAIVFPLSLVSVAGLEMARRRTLGFLETVLSPSANRLRQLRRGFSRRIAELQQEAHVARVLGKALDEAIRPRAGCVFLRSANEWRPAYAFGKPAPTQLALLEDAIPLVEETTVVHLASEEDPDDAQRAGRLRALGFELVAILRRGGNTLGAVLLTDAGTRVPYTRLEIDYVETAVQHATIALHNAHLAEDLLAAERHATTGQMALALAHDAGKDLDWLRRLVERLPSRLSDPRRLERDLATLQELTRDLVGTIRGFIRDANRSAAAEPYGLEFDCVIDRAIRTVSRIHGRGRVGRSIDPQVRNIQTHRNLERVLVNLLDNGLLASPEGEPVHLFATMEQGVLLVSITDRGHGMDGVTAQKAFREGFTTRGDRGGTGIGLPISREIVNSLGGSIELSPNSSRGTSATVRLPIGGGDR